jgi:primase-polymerase (primpol)-like protein
MYFDKHYLTVTGEVVDGFTSEIKEVDPELILYLYNKWFPEKANKPAKRETSVKTDFKTLYLPEPVVNDPNDPLQCLSSNKDQVMLLCRNAPAGFGKKFDRLFTGEISEYKSKSEADMAIAGIIAFHTSDYSIIKEIIQESALWDKKWERDDYWKRTIMTAIRNRWGEDNAK